MAYWLPTNCLRIVQVLTDEEEEEEVAPGAVPGGQRVSMSAQVDELLTREKFKKDGEE